MNIEDSEFNDKWEELQKIVKGISSIADAYAESIIRLNTDAKSINKVIVKKVKEENGEKKDEIEDITDELKNSMENTDLGAKEQKTFLTKIKNKITKAFIGNTKTKTKTAINFQNFSDSDNKKISNAINTTLSNIRNSKDLVTFFNNPVIRYILYHSKVFPTFKNSFMQHVDEIVKVLPDVDLKEGQIRFGKTLGQAIRKQLYNGTNNKFQNWVLILGPASRKGSKNIKNIISNTKAALKNMNKNLGKVDRDDIDEETKMKLLSEICKEFGKEEEAMLYLKLGLLSDVKAKGASTDVINAVRRIKGKTEIKELESVNITSYSNITDLNGDIEKKITEAVG